MKNLRFLLVVVSLLFGTASVNAKEDFEVDGIYYNIIDYANSYVEVTYKGDFDSSFDEYAGDVVIPETVVYIGSKAFSKCETLNGITFKGTVEQWEAIEKGADWKEGVPATKVVCSNGEVVLGK